MIQFLKYNGDLKSSLIHLFLILTLGSCHNGLIAKGNDELFHSPSNSQDLYHGWGGGEDFSFYISWLTSKFINSTSPHPFNWEPTFQQKQSTVNFFLFKWPSKLKQVPKSFRLWIFSQIGQKLTSAISWQISAKCLYFCLGYHQLCSWLTSFLNEFLCHLLMLQCQMTTCNMTRVILKNSRREKWIFKTNLHGPFCSCLHTQSIVDWLLNWWQTLWRSKIVFNFLLKFSQK